MDRPRRRAHAAVIEVLFLTQPRPGAAFPYGRTRRLALTIEGVPETKSESAEEVRMADLMHIIGLGALGVLIVLLGRLALQTFSRWLDHRWRHVSRR